MQWICELCCKGNRIKRNSSSLFLLVDLILWSVHFSTDIVQRAAFSHFPIHLISPSSFLIFQIDFKVDSIHFVLYDVDDEFNARLTLRFRMIFLFYFSFFSLCFGSYLSVTIDIFLLLYFPFFSLFLARSPLLPVALHPPFHPFSSRENEETLKERRRRLLEEARKKLKVDLILWEWKHLRKVREATRESNEGWSTQSEMGIIYSCRVKRVQFTISHRFSKQHSA